MNAEAFAPGKILLLGEHSVVYTGKALGFPLEQGVRVKLSKGSGAFQAVVPKGFELDSPRPDDLFELTLGKKWRSQYDINVVFEIPPKSGFGSSASLTAALLRAQIIHNVHKKHESDATSLFKRVFKAEKQAHKHPSGVDPAIVLSNDGLLFFLRKGKKIKIQPVQTKTSKFHFVVASTGSHRGTKFAVSNLRELQKENKSIKKAIELLGLLTEEGISHIKQNRIEKLGHCMNLAHGVLSGCGLVGDKTEAAVRALKSHGALGAKMSGAGGEGGAVIALFQNKVSATTAQNSLEKAGAWSTYVSPITQSPSASLHFEL